jgi:hypothetical protein
VSKWAPRSTISLARLVPGCSTKQVRGFIAKSTCPHRSDLQADRHEGLRRVAANWIATKTVGPSHLRTSDHMCRDSLPRPLRWLPYQPIDFRACRSRFDRPGLLIRRISGKRSPPSSSAAVTPTRRRQSWARSSVLVSVNPGARPIVAYRVSRRIKVAGHLRTPFFTGMQKLSRLHASA